MTKYWKMHAAVVLLIYTDSGKITKIEVKQSRKRKRKKKDLE